MQIRENCESYYRQQLDEISNQMKIVRSKINQIGLLRLFLMIVIVVIIFVFGIKSIIAIIAILCFVGMFLFSLKRHDSLFVQRTYLEKKTQIVTAELDALGGNYANFDGGKDYIDSAHPFSLDLDIFGDSSIFQSINRTTNARSKAKLKERLLNPLLDKKTILKNQEAIKELSGRPDFLFDFITKGDSKNKDFDIVSFILTFLQNPIFSTTFWRYSFLLPILIIVVSVLLFCIGYSSAIFIISYCVLFFIGLIPMGGVSHKMKKFDQMIVSVKSYILLLKTVEQFDCQSEELKSLKNKLGQQQSKATEAIKELDRLSNQLGLSSTLLGVVILNPLFLWNVYYTRQLQKWLASQKNNIENWVDCIADMDSMISLGIYSFNHPENVIPHVNDKKECLIAEGLLHPMMNKHTAVTNDVLISDSPQFLIITGANMAGKSTYLRTVSLNLLLAEVGLPVFAKSFEFYPFSIITNLRTSDSLANNESYFFSELKKLKMIIDLLEDGRRLFIVLDEILKGTNSEDKQKGSIALMKQLLSNSGYGIIATHDLVLGDLEKEFPKEVKDYRFEGVIENDELFFSYKLKEGVAQNMNACFLMKKMGIKGL